MYFQLVSRRTLPLLAGRLCDDNYNTVNGTHLFFSPLESEGRPHARLKVARQSKNAGQIRKERKGQVIVLQIQDMLPIQERQKGYQVRTFAKSRPVTGWPEEQG
jgi:hypothetical protein